MPKPVELGPRLTQETIENVTDPETGVTEEPVPILSPKPAEQPTKCRRVMVEEVEDLEAPIIREPTPVSPHTPVSSPKPTTHNPPASDEPPTGNESHMREVPAGEEEAPHARDGTRPGPNRRTRRHLKRILCRWKGLFVEDFPDPLAGAPVSEEQAPPPDIPSYLRLCGNLASLWNFDIAELLMTSGMTDAARESVMTCGNGHDG
ncbi:hypothetical protein FRC06_003241, partial [Ceratobasidium sp. 370]